jgi:hypothetical protein
MLEEEVEKEKEKGRERRKRCRGWRVIGSLMVWGGEGKREREHPPKSIGIAFRM